MVAGFTALALLVGPRPARADFGDIRKITASTSYTLEKGSFTVGVISPIQYGILDNLLLTTHPLLYLLLTPNACLKWKIFDFPGVAMSLSASYIETFLVKDSFPGSVSFFPSLTVPIGSHVSLSAQGGYVLDVYPTGHGATFGGGLAVLVTDSDLLQFTVQDDWFRGSGFVRPTGIASYTHAFYQMRVTAGVAVGNFPIQVGNATTNIKNLPAYPVLDVWWLL